jgi:3-keto-disaccharide hydrolase
MRTLMIAALGMAACVSAGSTDLLAGGLAPFARQGDANWSFADGMAQATSGSRPSVLISREDYRDFELDLEVYVSVEHNSGVFIRCANRGNITATDCYEINIYDKRPDQTYRTGGAPGFFKPLAQVDAGGKWNHMKIRAEGPHILVVLNGVTTIDADGPLMSNGPIALQWGAGEVKFRNVRVRRLG